MKRLYTTEKYKKLMRIRQRSALAASRRRSGLHAGDPEAHLSTIRIVAPARYSLIGEPEEAIRFLSRLHSTSTHKKFFVDLSNTITLTCDAISVLAATIESGLCHPPVAGNRPRGERPRQILLDSGFYQRVRVWDPQPQSHAGKIIRRHVYLDRAERTVATGLAQELIKFASLKLGRQTVDKPSYGVLIDVMDNTFAHASDVMAGQVSWWASVYCDLERKKACYCFVDLGVGIFKSRSFQQRIRYLPTLIRGKAEERMRALLEG